MPGTIDLTFVLEMIGTVAFALSGAMVAIQKRLDLLGILVLGITTAVGGGMIRDLIIGVHPPMMFVKPVYVVVSAIFILILFLIIKVNHSSLESTCNDPDNRKEHDQCYQNLHNIHYYIFP